MFPKRAVFFVGVFCVAVLGCTVSPVFADEYKDARRSYAEGRFDEAVRLLAVKLRKKPDHRDSIQLLPVAVNAAYNRHLELARDAAKQSQWDEARRHYEAMVNIRRELDSLPPLIDKKSRAPVDLPKPPDVSDERDKAQRNAAEGYYQRGLAAMQEVGQSDRAVQEFEAALRLIPDYRDASQMATEALYQDALRFAEQSKFRDAYKKLERCEQRAPGYKDVAKLMADLRDKAKVRIGLMPFVDQTGSLQFGALGDSLTQQVHTSLRGVNPALVEFYTQDYVRQQFVKQLVSAGKLDPVLAVAFKPDITEATATDVGKAVGIDYFVFGKITGVYPKPANETLQAQGQDRALFVGEAVWWLYRREGSAELEASWEVREVETGQQLFYESSRASELDRTEWVTYQGEERAIPSWVRARITGNRPVKPADQLVRGALAKVAEDIARKLRTRLELD